MRQPGQKTLICVSHNVGVTGSRWDVTITAGRDWYCRDLAHLGAGRVIGTFVQDGAS